MKHGTVRHTPGVWLDRDPLFCVPHLQHSLNIALRTAKTAASHFTLSLTHGLTGFLNAIQALPVIPKPETTDFDPTGTVGTVVLLSVKNTPTAHAGR